MEQTVLIHSLTFLESANEEEDTLWTQRRVNKGLRGNNL
jgi:hypothetical protein